MTTARTLRRALLPALAAALLLAAGCSRPPDDAWMKITSFRAESATSTPVGTYPSKLLENTVDQVYLGLTNFSGKGTGIMVREVTVSYAGVDAPLPVHEYLVTLYLPAAAEAGKTVESVLQVPLATVPLKTAVRAAAAPPVVVQATFTVTGFTDEGGEVTVQGFLPIVFS